MSLIFMLDQDMVLSSKDNVPAKYTESQQELRGHWKSHCVQRKSLSKQTGCDAPMIFTQTEVEEKNKEGIRKFMKIREMHLSAYSMRWILYTLNMSCRRMGGQYSIFILSRPSMEYWCHPMLFYKKVSSDLVNYGFELNPYESYDCQQECQGPTMAWHVDDLKVSH